MDSTRFKIPSEPEIPQHPEPSKNAIGRIEALKHLGLFIITFISVSWTGILFVGFNDPFQFVTSDLFRGALFSFLLLSFLTVHEFGHYFAAIRHKISVTLPYFIPLPFIGIGTLGAVIRIKERIKHSYKMFDVGVAGPLAGFLVALAVLLIGFVTLPDASYINNFPGHEETKLYVSENGNYPPTPLDGEEPGILTVGQTPLYSFLASFFPDAPPMWEMYHYPFLFAGWLGLFFTALNLMPVGQLDGGHILYCLLGFKRHRMVARSFFAAISVLGGITAVQLITELLYSYGIDNTYGSLSWLVWAALLFLIMNKAYRGDRTWLMYGWTGSLIGTAVSIYMIGGDFAASKGGIWIFWMLIITFFIKIEHPPVLYEEPLDTKRKVIGWLSMCIFVLCISLTPISIVPV